ncbi:P-loop containing nucleoside triphosphate hydrolase protein [Cucurbitaria berberidis CBS 394.84]|uniref:P-loop containing nucleoside triphosphate hydrolase protein n=1 Tax=Cucurbitaria berberidis CBS 394.84 TaxID=1168544 RepID=A0A9P4GHQ4_9PLEO|nr:P-loop containing nucleoside triphosphate hydrolase protein [Cucurbitaria berberidis CBS 394.84]KAF1845411.1 P-loop containing nucleoside triphosphate hydrolase protein [Cucurbitaria berberidis CBS 394.84]
MTLEVGELYREKPHDEWDEWIPDNVPRDIATAPESLKRAIVVYKERRPPKPALVLHSIVVQSPLLRKVLNRMFEGYEGISTKLKELRFYAPFHEFYYRWHWLERLMEEEKDEPTRKHLEFIFPLVHSQIFPHIETMEDFTKNGVISFDYLWAIFPPGTNVFSQLDGQERIFSLVKTAYGVEVDGTRYMYVKCRYIDGDGTKFGFVHHRTNLYSFEGVREITKLEIFPAHLHPDAEGLVRRLQIRGEKFENLNGFHHLAYSGLFLDHSQPSRLGTNGKHHIDNSRIIVDSVMFSQKVILRDRFQPLEDHNEQTDDGDLIGGVLNVMRRATRKAFERFSSIVKQYDDRLFTGTSTSKLTAEQLMLCTATVKGFCLVTKKWAEFYVNNTAPIRWNEQAFSRLVLPHGNKEIIHAFVEEQLSGEVTFDDIIQGKGQGFIMLLSGEPGVGKTLTAESVSEKMRKPLYSMSAGELGETASEVEGSLTSVLGLTSKWGAILLLDECDIFLERRTTTDIRRNRLVSIFLRHLEYFKGVMFLTTNRVSTIDAAFESRVHLTIDYPTLDEQSRLHIWRTFMTPSYDGVYSSNLSEEELLSLAKTPLNGRQIKNTVKTAQLLAKQKKRPLEMQDVELVHSVRMGTRKRKRP